MRGKLNESRAMKKLIEAEKRVENIKRQHGRYTLEEAALVISENTGEFIEGIQNKLITAVKNKELKRYAPGSFVECDNKIIRAFYEHVYWNDLNVWLKKNEPRLDFKFPKPGTSKAKREAGTNEPNPISDWKSKVQAEAHRIWKTLLKRGCSPTRLNIAKGLPKWCRGKDIKTDSGIFPSESYIYRHVLSKKVWRSPSE